MPRRLDLLCALVALVPTAVHAQTPTELSSRADYTIEARVDTQTMQLAGEETITWTNHSKDDVFDLWFHTYWNAWANDRSTFITEAGGARRGVDLEQDWGWQHIVSIRVNEAELLSKLTWRSVDDGNDEDRSVFSVDLPHPARTDDQVVIKLGWAAQIPRSRPRTGYKDDFLFIAQWFPKLGVYETGNGWNCHQFHANTEFFSDYGTYDVTLDLPERYAGRIGASGAPSAKEELRDGRVIARFAAPSAADRATPDSLGKTRLVHDFAWTASPRTIVHEGQFRWDAWAATFHDEVDRVGLALGRTPEELRGRDVRITLLLQPEHAAQAAAHMDATCTALFFYGLWFGTYPYEHITVVDPAWGDGSAGGMEYPTLFTAGTRKHVLPGMFTPESVTVHECGHQFWYGLVGNNEFEAGWLDEGFNTFSQNEALAQRYGRNRRTSEFLTWPIALAPAAREPGGSGLASWLSLSSWVFSNGLDLTPARASGVLAWWRAQPLLTYAAQRDDPRTGDRLGYLADPDSDPIDTAGWKYVDSKSYGTNSYRRTATMLRTLRGLVGADRFTRAMRLYSERWRYRHPYAQDFFDTFQEGADADLGWFFEEAFQSTATVDWKIEVSQRKISAPRGWFFGANGALVERTADKSEKSAAPDKTDKLAAGEGWKNNVLVRRTGSFLLPIELELGYDDGALEQLIWTREEQLRSSWWKPLDGRPPTKAKLTSAVLDPTGRYPLDMDMSNNRWYAKSDEGTPLRWSERVFSLYGEIVHWFGGIGG